MNQMEAFHKFLFQASYFLTGKTSVIRHYKEFMETQWWSYDTLVALQFQQLQRLVHFVYDYSFR